MRLARIECLQPAQRLIDGGEVNGPLVAKFQRRIQLHFWRSATAFFSGTSSGVIGQNAPHHACSNRQHLEPVIPIYRPLIEKAQIRFMDEGGRLKSVIGTFTAEVAGGELAQLIVKRW